VLPEALAALPEALRHRIAMTQQCRPEDLDRVRAAYARLGIAAELASFFPDIAGQLAAAHLVVARAGASTVAELAVAGRPAILVPLPGAIDDHQSANATSLAQAGGAWVINQATLTPAELARQLALLLEDPATLEQAAASAATLGRPDAARSLADLVDRCIRQETPNGGRQL